MAEAGRVIAGSARGIRLLAPGPGTRPLADRVKQTLFAILEPDLPGARVLDLFAGSGAGGIEALSRGATRATFVERDAAAIRTIEENLRRAGLTARADVRRAEVLAWLAAAAGGVGDATGRAGRDGGVANAGGGAAAGLFDVVLVDPPYADADLLVTALERLSSAGILGPRAHVIAKHFWRTAPPARVGLLRSERVRRFGETALTFYRAFPDERGGAEGGQEER